MKIGSIPNISRMQRDRREKPKEQKDIKEDIKNKAIAIEPEAIKPIDVLSVEEIEQVDQMSKLKEMSKLYFSSIPKNKPERLGNMQNLLEKSKFSSQHQFKGINIVG